MIKSPEEFAALVAADDPEEAKRAIQVQASEDVWIAILKAYPRLRFEVAQNKTVPLRVLEVLAVDADPRVRSMVARKRKASPAILEKLARDEDSGVRLAVAYNPSTPQAVLEILRADAWQEVRDHAGARLIELQGSE